MLKCKHCKGTDFGLTVTETKVTGYRAVNGEVIECLGAQEPITEQKVTFCFGCNNSITENDLYELETCPVCGKEVDELVDGKCHDCDAQVKMLANMSKEELILMMLQGKMPNLSVVAQTKAEEKTEAKVEVEEKSEDKEEEMTPQQKAAITRKKNAEAKKKAEEEAKVESTNEVVEVESVEEVATENVVDSNAISDEVIIPEEEANTNLEIENVEVGENDLNEIGTDGDVLFPEDSIDSEDDILAQIDKYVDLDSLNIISEDIDQPI